MGVEIERKFLVTSDDWRLGEGVHFRLGYLCAGEGRTVRVRTEGERAVITLKGRMEGVSRAEYEYEIPFDEAVEILDTLCVGPLIEKRRRRIEHAGMVWEVDEFLGENEGLVVAEIELETEEQSFERPDWVGAEVSGDDRYRNASLVHHPFSLWGESRD